jgi:hypothetical protein
VYAADLINNQLRLRGIYWYRAGREAWEVAGKPEEVVRPADW